MGDRKEEYIRILTEQIRCKKARNQVAREMLNHMEEQEEFYVSEGMTRDEAQAEAVREMGDPVEAGAALDMVHRPQMVGGLLALMGILYAAGFLVSCFLQKNFTDASLLPGAGLHHIIYILIGFMIMAGVCYVDYSRLGLWARELTVLLAVMIAAGIMLFGVPVNGATVFLHLPLPGAPSVNIKMLCYLFFPLYGAVLYGYRGQGYSAVVKGILWMLPAICISLYVPSTSTAMMLFLMFVLILSFAVGRGWFAVSVKYTLAGIWGTVLLIPAAVCVWVVCAGAGYQAERLQAVLHPGSGEAGYLFRMLREILGGSVLRGAGESAVSAAEGFPGGTEFGLVYVTAYYGILAAVLLIGVLAFLFICFLGLSLRQKNELGMIMGGSCSVVFFVQLLFYVLVNTGVFPVGGVYCPFFTYGGTGVVVTNVLIGLLLSIYRYQEIPLDMKAKRRLKVSVKSNI